MTTHTDATAAQTEYTMTDHGTIVLGTSTFTVESQTFHNGHVMTWLTGARGAVYFLRGYLERGGDSGRRQVVSWKSGQPLRVRGNEVQVMHVGDIIEAL